MMRHSGTLFFTVLLPVRQSDLRGRVAPAGDVIRP